METTKQYDGTTLLISQVEFLEEIEKLIGEKIPCREDRTQSKQQIAQAIQPQQNSAQSILQMQYQAIKAQADQMEQLAQQPIETLEKTYEAQFLAQFLAQASPAMKAGLEAQLNALIPMYGEDHPSVKKIKAMLEMDESKAKAKAKSLAVFMQENFKLQAMIKEKTQVLNKKIYSEIPFEELETEYIEYYKSMTQLEYQTQLKVTVDVGIQQLGELDPNLAGLKPLLGMTETNSVQFAKQAAQNSYNSIKQILQQYGVQLQTQQQAVQQAQQQATQAISKRSASVSHFGFICQEKYIIGLNLGWKNLEILPESVGSLSKLQFLDLTNDKIEELPQNFGQLLELEELLLKGTLSNDGPPLYNEIKYLPDSFCDLKNLRKLDISGNGFLEIPEKIGQLSSLEEIKLESNKISKIPDSIGDLTKLKRLELNSNKISMIPNSMCQLGNLDDLFLSFNSISQIPDCIGQLTNLKRLLLASNSLSAIPNTVTNLANLNTLWLSDNQLTELPEDIVKLNLTDLSVPNNQISIFPYHIWTMDTITKLDLTGNPFRAEEQEIAQQDAKAIKEYCRQRASIAVMIISTPNDSKNHRLDELKAFLETQSEIFTVLAADKDLLEATDLVLFLGTAGSIKIPEYVSILDAAKEQKIQIIPLKGLDIDWPDLSIVELSRELGHEFTPNDFEGFCSRIYEYIQLLKRTHNIFKDKSAIMLKKSEEKGGDAGSFAAFKTELTRIINSADMKGFYEQFKTQITMYYNNTRSSKIAQDPLFLSQAFSLFTAYLQQKQYYKQMSGGNQQ